MAFNAGVHRCQFMYIHVNRCQSLSLPSIQTTSKGHFVLLLAVHLVAFARVASTEYLLAKFFFFGSFFFLRILRCRYDIAYIFIAHVRVENLILPSYLLYNTRCRYG